MTITTRAIGEQINLATVLNSKVESPILQTEMGLNVQATGTGHAVRWNEFSLKHNNDGTFKGIVNGDLSATAAIVATKLAIQKMYKKSITVNPSATINTYGTQVDLSPTAGYVSVTPRAVDVVFGGTFGSETVTVDITVTFSDATTATVSKTATATGTTSLTNTELMTLAKDDVYINKISLKSKSSIASSIATVSVNHYGHYL